MQNPSWADILFHLGEDRESYFHAGAPPIIQSNNFAYPTVQALRDTLKKEFETPFYTRGYNPTVAILRQKLAALEGAEDALVLGSGSAAIATAVMSVVKAGDHVVCVQKPYSWTYKLFQHFLIRFGISVDFIDGTQSQHFQQAIRPNTRLFMLESPNSMTFELQHISEVVAIAKAHGITTIMDNSYATPLYQQPLTLGVDMVCHSASKYFSGHSDVVAGVIAGSKAHIQSIFANEYMTLGAAVSPHDAWLILRGLRTLPIRLHQVNETALQVVNFLANHPKVERVYYPFHPSHPQFELAKQQMKGAGGMFSIQLNVSDYKGIERFCDRLSYFLLACSWGGYESLALPIAAYSDAPEQHQGLLPWNLIRMYVGLEPAEILIEDLKQALDAV